MAKDLITVEKTAVLEVLSKKDGLKELIVAISSGSVPHMLMGY